MLTLIETKVPECATAVSAVESRNGGDEKSLLTEQWHTRLGPPLNEFPN